ncbi:hypothetical protein ACFLXI_05125 [Chloroflexota bacterium]
MNYWRSIAAPIIRKVIEENANKEPDQLKKALFEAYPFGERKYWPYKVWLDEIQVQLGTKKPKKQEIPKDQLSFEW